MKPYYLRDNEEICQCVAIGISDDCVHDERYECKVCNKCCADEPMLSERNDAYEDKSTCLQCVLKDKETTLEDIAGLYA
jgi:hypothetical protein